MANIDFKGLDEIRLSMQEVAELPEAVKDEMLNVAADIVVAEQKKVAKAVLWSPWENPVVQQYYKPGTTEKSIKKGKPKTDRGGNRVLFITPAGNRKRGKKEPKKIRNAEIAYFNEFGTRTVMARGWMKFANEQSAERATAAQAEVYDKFLKSKNL